MNRRTARLRRYKRRKDEARTPKQFLKWSIRYHQLAWRVYRSLALW